MEDIFINRNFIKLYMAKRYLHGTSYGASFNKKYNILTYFSKKMLEVIRSALIIISNQVQ